MIKLLMALSTGKYERRTCTAEMGLIDGQNQNWSTEYETQLEPTPFFLMDNSDEDVEIILLCSKETLEPGDNGRDSRFDEFKRNVEQRAKAHERSFSVLLPIKLDIEDEKTAIKEAVERLRSEGNYDLWIDTHGGPRDIAFTLNSVVSLLKVYGISVNKFVTVLPDENDQSRIRDASESFNMLDFVSGLNEFVNFGVANTLKEHLKSKEDSQLLDPISKISDGTRLCDPALYEEGLDELGDVINSAHPQGYMAIFSDYIRSDYGNLLDKEKRTPLDIIKRCFAKGLYQQALTYIESSMPEMFFKQHILYFDRNSEETINEIKKQVGKKYDNAIHFVFDQFCFPINDYYERCEADGKKQRLIKILASDPAELNASFFEGDYSKEITVAKPNTGQAVGKIEVLTALRKEYMADAGRLIRLHKAIKECRNTINHASRGEDIRPNLEQIRKGILNYIKLSEKIFCETAIICDEERIAPRGITCVAEGMKIKESPKRKAKYTFIISGFGMTKNPPRKPRIEGSIKELNRNGIIPVSNISDYKIGDELLVAITNDHKGRGPIQCKID